MTAAPAIVLASASPRRRVLLDHLGVPYAIRPAHIDERPRPDEGAPAMAMRVALAKAEAVAAPGRDGIVVAADTVVVLDGEILGKPKDRVDALRTLRRLRGRRHEVITAIALVNQHSGQTFTRAVTTRVHMRKYSDKEIEAYVASGDSFDKAGAYAIQNDLLRPVERIEGCYFNVVGLPLCELARGLIEVGYPEQALPIDRLADICPHDVTADS